MDYYKNVTELKLAKSYFNLNEKSRADSILQNLVDNPDIDENIKMAALSDIAFINVVKSEKNLIREIQLYIKMINIAALRKLKMLRYF